MVLYLESYILYLPTFDKKLAIVVYTSYKNKKFTKELVNENHF